MATSPLTATGVVPGFPSGLPLQLQDAWLELKKHPDRVAIEVPAVGHVRITITSNPKELWKVAIFLTLLGFAMLVGTWLFDRYQSSPRFDLPIRYNLAVLYITSSMCAAAGVMVLLIQLSTGGAVRDTILEASLGRLKLDHYIGGDHVVREYSPAEINCIWTDGAIEIGARLGAFSTAQFCPAEVQDAAAEIVGVLFWGDDAVLGRNVKSPAAANGRMNVLIGKGERTA